LILLGDLVLVAKFRQSVISAPSVSPDDTAGFHHFPDRWFQTLAASIGHASQSNARIEQMPSSAQCELERILARRGAEALIRTAWDERVLAAIEIGRKAAAESSYDYCIGSPILQINECRQGMRRANKLALSAADAKDACSLLEQSSRMGNLFLQMIKLLSSLSENSEILNRAPRKCNRSAAPGQQAGPDLTS
jgi:hypothetical protein